MITQDNYEVFTDQIERTLNTLQHTSQRHGAETEDGICARLKALGVFELWDAMTKDIQRTQDKVHLGTLVGYKFVITTTATAVNDPQQNDAPKQKPDGYDAFTKATISKLKNIINLLRLYRKNKSRYPELRAQGVIIGYADLWLQATEGYRDYSDAVWINAAKEEAVYGEGFEFVEVYDD